LNRREICRRQVLKEEGRESEGAEEFADPVKFSGRKESGPSTDISVKVRQRNMQIHGINGDQSGRFCGMMARFVRCRRDIVERGEGTKSTLRGRRLRTHTGLP
jgi:hypothetical protein